MTTEYHGFLDAAGRAVYASFHLPDTNSPRPPLLLLPPFAEERRAAYRLLVRLARAGSAAGHPVVRFDFSGTGESSGEHATATLAAWNEDALAVMAAAVDRFPAIADQWIAVGARLGGNLALRLAATGRIAGVIAIEPIPAGADLVRDLERRQRIKDMIGGAADAPTGVDAGAVWSTGAAVDFGGYEIGAALGAELTGLSLSADLDALPRTRWLQALRISGSKRLPPAWEELAAALAGRPGSAVRLVHDKPFWGQLEYYESETIIHEVLDILSPDRPATAVHADGN